MQAALRELGYHETYHFFSLFSNIQDCDMWHEAFEAKYGCGKPFGREEWDMLLGHCAAVCDLPSICFAPELIAAYPEAKVVLVSRDIDRWYKSFYDIVVSRSFSPIFTFLGYLEPNFLGQINALSGKIFHHYFHGSTRDELGQNARKVFLEHYEQVRRLTPKDRLLEFELGSEWKPLCDFLGKEVPNRPFPRVNDTAAMKEKLEIMFKRAAIAGLRKALVVGSGLASLAVAFWYYKA